MNDLYYVGMYPEYDYYRNGCTLPSQTHTTTFYNDREGFIKGNIQKNSYQPYRNYNPSMPIVNNDRERMLLEIQKYGFYLIDMGLYLDLNPNDKSALANFNDARGKYYRLINEFNKNYYPLMFTDSNSNDSYEWLEGPFPWVRGN